MRRQSYRAFECIVVDDGSRDATADVALRFQRVDARFRLERQKALGLVAALNVGVARAQAPWLARMDADDLMARDRLRLQLALLKRQPELAGVGCHVRMFPRARLSQGRLRYEAWLNSLNSADDVFRDRFVECTLAHPTWLFSTELVRSLGYRALDAPEDYDLLLRAFAQGHRLGVVPQRLLHWREHDRRLSRLDGRYQQSRFFWLKARWLSSSFLKEHPRYVLWGYGDTGRCLSRELSQLGHLPSHIVEVHPGRIGQSIAGAKVVAPRALVALRNRPLVVSVAGSPARSEIRAALAAMGFREGPDYVCAA